MVSAIFPFIDDNIAWASWNFLDPALDANPGIMRIMILDEKYFGLQNGYVVVFF